MRALLVLAVLLVLAPSVPAQTSAFFPLTVGNRWVYERSTQTASPGGGGQTTPAGTIEWTVIGEAVTPSGPVTLLRIGSTTCGVRIDTTSGPYPVYTLVAVEGASCSEGIAYGAVPFLNASEAGFYLPPGNPEPTTVTVGGVAYPGRQTTFGLADWNIAGQYPRNSSWTAATGIGLVTFGVFQAGAGQDRVDSATLRYAVVDGVEYGTRLTGTDAGPERETLSVSAGPNPVRSSTTLRYTLVEPADVRLVVVDGLGRTVRQVDLGARPAGAGEATLPAAGLAPGLYTVRVVAGERSAAARLVVAQ